MYKYKLLEWKPVAIIHTIVDLNLVTLSSLDIANPNYKIGIMAEVQKDKMRPWDIDRIFTILVLHGMVYSLTEVVDADKNGKQSFRFELIEDVPPQIENIVESIIAEAL